MFKSKLSMVAAGALLASTAVSATQAADLVLGVPNWPSANATSNILKVVIEENFGLDVELQSS